MFHKIQELLRLKAEQQAKLNLIPYKGSLEIKEISEKKYIYVRSRVASKNTSTYVGLYSEELYITLLRQVKEAREIKKIIRKLEKELAILGYTETDLSNEVIINLDFARANMKSIIYDQAILEGVATTFPETELIIDNGKINNLKAEDVLKIINLKHAWEFVLDKDVISSPSSYYLSQYIAKLVNEGFYYDGGKIRSVPVTIKGSTYVPNIPIESVIKDNIDLILKNEIDDIDKAIELALYIMKSQPFIDGNKRTGIIFANHYLISKGKGLLVVPYDLVDKFKKLLVAYYEDKDTVTIKNFFKEKCFKKIS